MSECFVTAYCYLSLRNHYRWRKLGCWLPSKGLEQTPVSAFAGRFVLNYTWIGTALHYQRGDLKVFRSKKCAMLYHMIHIILTVPLRKLGALACSGALVALFLLSCTRWAAHLHVKNSSTAPSKNTIVDSMTIADPKPAFLTINRSTSAISRPKLIFIWSRMPQDRSTLAISYWHTCITTYREPQANSLAFALLD